MNDFPFDNSDDGIDLGGVGTMTGGSAPPGYHVGTIVKAESKPVASGAKMLFLTFDTAKGAVRDRLTISHPKSGSDKKAKLSVEIGLKKIKSILTFGTKDGEACDASKYRGPATMLGIRVGLHAEKSDDFTGKDGETVKGGAQVVMNGRPYFTEGDIAQLQNAAS